MKLIRWLLVAGVLAVFGVISVALVRLATAPVEPLPSQDPVKQTEVVPADANAKPAAPIIPQGISSLPRPVANLPIPGIVAAANPPTPVPSPTPSPTPKPQIPYRGEVERVQKLLTELGYQVGPVDGKLGQRTKFAIEMFQKQVGLPLTSDADAATLAKLEEVVKQQQAVASTTPVGGGKSSGTMLVSATTQARREGEPQLLVLQGRKPPTQPGPPPKLDNRDNVRELQKALAAAKVYDAEIDGKFGKYTLEAIKAFQKKNDLPVTGKVDVATWRKLFDVMKKAAPPPEKDLIVVAPVSKVLKKAPLRGGIAWYTPKPQSAVAHAAKSAEGQTPATAVATAPSVVAKPGDLSPQSVEAVATRSSSASEVQLSSATPNPSAPRNDSGAQADATAPATESSEPPTPHRPPQSLEVANATSQASQSQDAVPAPGPKPSADEVVVKLNPDAAAPNAAPLGTPLPVSSEVASANPTSPTGQAATPATKLALLPETSPRNGAMDSTYASVPAAPTPSVQIESVGKDTNPAQVLADTLQRNLDPATESQAAKNALKALAEEMKNGQLPSARDEAKQKVEAAEQAYQLLKRNVGNRKSGLAAMQLARVEAGFKAMKDDFDKGRYERIIKLGDGFRRGIEIVTAQAYVESALANETVRKKLTKAEIKVLEDLCEYAKRNPNDLAKQEKFIDAADALKAKVGPIALSAKSNSGTAVPAKNSKTTTNKNPSSTGKTSAKR